MPNIIHLTDIQFRNHLNVFDLSCPLYQSVIKYADDKVSQEARAYLQVEPAFQIIDAPDPLFEFHFQIDAKEPAVFSKIDGLLRAESLLPWKDNSWFKSSIFNDQHCCLQFETNHWTDRIRAVRIHCSSRENPEISRSDYGLTLVLLKPGAEPAIGGKLTEPLEETHLTLKVLSVAPFPRYDIFEYGGLPPGISIEPVFRTSEDRPIACVKVEMAAGGKKFKSDMSTFDDVLVRQRNPPRPDELSKVVEDPDGIRFTYDSTGLAGNVDGPARIYSFLVDIEDIPPMVVEASSLSRSLTASSDAGQPNSRPPQNPPRPRPYRLASPPRRPHVDPVILQEPIPTGIP